ncbi:MAG: methyltransferase domain-containing protein [Planctomycetes bacterium]|nr:methyltransferase domain-containing protein [Planctomycetota bacterium]
MSISNRLLEYPWVYRAWQRPFAEAKLRPVRRHNDLRSVRRVLDVGCGPGTNSRHFEHTDYCGIDINPAYIASAARRFRGTFIAADATTYCVPPDRRYDFVLINSFLHHLADGEVRALLANLWRVLSDAGYVHVLELVLPAHRGPARFLARHDRGRFARSVGCWSELLAERFRPVVFEPFSLRLCGITLWNMVYFKGAAT